MSKKLNLKIVKLLLGKYGCRNRRKEWFYLFRQKKLDRLKKILKEEDCEYCVLGEFTDDKKLLCDKWDIVTIKKPSKNEEKALKFAWTAVKYVRSNAIVLANENQTLGIGAGQMSRVDAAFMAGHKYGQFLKDNLKPEILVLASDAFFPFADALEEAAKMGISAIIQPGGSIRDEEVIEAANKLGISMVMTGIRHFKH
ncbi:MAG: hypothetical protein KKD35_06505 [Elusimicrobia bacterium]|nr:hypothetical protein [Elusimicrobiota bacterium]